jgi:hypothetical protein
MPSTTPLGGTLSSLHQDQSFGTDDEPAGDNLALGFPPISESFHLSQALSNNPTNGDGNILLDESGNPSQVSFIEPESNPPQVINQPHLITEVPSSEPVGTTYSAACSDSEAECPFYKLHHKSPYEFLNFSQIPDEDKTLLFGIDDDNSSKVDQKIAFIVGNLRNSTGVWPMMFLEKLNKITVHLSY